MPLAKEQELAELVQADPTGVLLPSGGQGGRLTAEQFRRPFQPALARLCILQSHEQSEVVEPGGVLPAKRLELRTQGRRGAGLVVFPGPRQEAVLELDHRAKINPLGWKAGTGKVSRLEQVV